MTTAHKQDESYSQPEEEATSEQLQKLEDLQNQIDELENILTTAHKQTNSTEEQLKLIKELEKEIEKVEAADIEHEIIQKLQKQNQKLDEIEKKIHNTNSSKNEKTSFTITPHAYCVKCKTKRVIKNPEETIMKNGRHAIKGICSTCNCNVFRIGKLKIN